VSEFAQLGDRLPNDKLLVIFDGRCGFCNGTVRWFLRRDRFDRLRFAPSESAKVAELLARHRLGPPGCPAQPESVVAVSDPGGLQEQIFLRSDAAVAIMSQLPRPWPAVAAAFSLIPRPLRDLGYRLVARFRYRIWGRLATCPIPTAEERARFL
jgi:predicted DCC family thiol-disulfide oxidoreductase YuxK